MEDVANYLWGLDWGAVLRPTLPLPEAFLRMSMVYLVLYLLLRLVLKREAGVLGITDLLVVVLLADAVQNAMAGGYQSVTDGLILAAILIFWDWALSYLAFHWRSIRRVLRPAPLLLVRDGEVVWANLRKELLTEEELLGQIRLQGIGRLEDVAYAFMETDGRVSVVPKGKGPGARGNRRRHKI